MYLTFNSHFQVVRNRAAYFLCRQYALICHENKMVLEIGLHYTRPVLFQSRRTQNRASLAVLLVLVTNYSFYNKNHSYRDTVVHKELRPSYGSPTSYSNHALHNYLKVIFQDRNITSKLIFSFKTSDTSCPPTNT